MFLPYADEHPREGRTPWVTWSLIAANVWIFFMLASGPDYGSVVKTYGFTPAIFDPITLFTSLFLHGSLMHLAGNMWFLYLFGDNVENRCGPSLYLAAYLAAGVAGDLCQFAIFPDSDIPTIGASGAIFGAMGMYLFFFPRNRIKIFYFLFIFFGTTVVRTIWVIGIFFLLEVVNSRMQALGGLQDGVGHLAHSGGFAAGAALAFLYTMLRLVKDDRAHLWAHATGSAAPAEDSHAAEAHDPMLEGGGRREGIPETDPRREIVALLHAGRTDEARRAWRRYAFDHHDDALPPREQLEVALALDKNGERGAARDAYERLLAHYPAEQPYAAEANLALAGMLLAEMKESGDARELPLVERLLRQAVTTHPSPPRRAVAMKWLDTLQG